MYMVRAGNRVVSRAYSLVPFKRDEVFYILKESSFRRFTAESEFSKYCPAKMNQ